MQNINTDSFNELSGVILSLISVLIIFYASYSFWDMRLHGTEWDRRNPSVNKNDEEPFEFIFGYCAVSFWLFLWVGATYGLYRGMHMISSASSHPDPEGPAVMVIALVAMAMLAGGYKAHMKWLEMQWLYAGPAPEAHQPVMIEVEVQPTVS